MPAAEREQETLEVFRRRYVEARQAGLEHVEAEAFAGSTVDVGDLRRLVEAGCPPVLIARLLL